MPGFSLHQFGNPACKKCELHISTHNVCVMGRGNMAAKIVLIGEAPGESEATHGKPFCGRSGQWMNLQLHMLGMDSLVYITNAVKCRPPRNRTPTNVERVACIPYLKSELNTLEPSVVVALGKTAAKSLGVENEKRHRLLHSVRHRFMIVHTWHPSYVLRMGGSGTRIAEEFIGALRLAKERL